MAILLIIIVILLTYFKGNKLGLNLGGNKKDSIVLIKYL
jgi:preprotein translocase subunit SecG